MNDVIEAVFTWALTIAVWLAILALSVLVVADVATAIKGRTAEKLGWTAGVALAMALLVPFGFFLIDVLVNGNPDAH